MSLERWVVPLSDREIIRFCEDVRKKYSDSQFTVWFVDNNTNNLDDPVLQKISKYNSFILWQIHITFGSVLIEYTVNHGKPTHLALFSAKKAKTAVHEKQHEFAAYCASKVGVPPASGPELSDESPIAAGYSKIEGALSQAVDRFHELQAEFQKSNNELREQHRSEIETLRSELVAERTVLESEMVAKQAELNAAKKELDDRSNTHARRAIRSELKDAVSTSLERSSFAEKADAKRNMIRVAYVLPIVAMAGFAVYSSYTLNLAIASQSTAGIWLTGIKTSVSSISTFALILLYLRWEVQWINQQAQFEQTLASTMVDIDRASWVAESLLEWNKESPEKEMPPELLESFTRRLFDWEAKVEDHQSAQDSLASALLGSASKLRIGPDGADVEYDRRGVKRMGREPN